MISVRLPEEIEHQIDQVAKAENKSRSEVIKDALQSYLHGREGELSPYQLGIGLFAAGTDGPEDLSETYKSRLKEKLREKYSH